MSGLQVRQRLSEDHDAVGKLLTRLLTALDNKDVQESYASMDLLWAKLAVHIRAEHLHLFPAVTSRLTKSFEGVEPDVSEARAIIENLRTDHDFFMRGFAGAIGILRELPKTITKLGDETKFGVVAHTVREIEKRLAAHNEIEEKQIYRWSSTMLTETEQSELLARINNELENRPPRFSEDAWTNFV